MIRFTIEDDRGPSTEVTSVAGGSEANPAEVSATIMDAGPAPELDLDDESDETAAEPQGEFASGSGDLAAGAGPSLDALES